MTVSPRKLTPTKLMQQIFEKKNSAKNHFVIQTAGPPPQHNEQQHVRSGQKNGSGASYEGDGSLSSSDGSISTCVHSAALRITRDHVRQRTRSRAGGGRRESTGWWRCSLQAPRQPIDGVVGGGAG